jgi:site-specific DNA-cytosine methylase
MVGRLTSVEICAGAGGQALGLEQAGFSHEAVVEIDAHACETLRRNRGAAWKIIEDDVANVDGRAFANVDLLAGGVPCPPFSIAGKQLGEDDDRDLFPQALRLVEEIRPRAVLLENVRGLATSRFDGYRAQVLARLRALGYETWWGLVNASDHGVPQLRPRFVLVAIREPWASAFRWPEPIGDPPPTVGQALADLMSASGWPGAKRSLRRSLAGARSTVGLTLALLAREQPGENSASMASASPTTSLARITRSGRCRSSPSAWSRGSRAFPTTGRSPEGRQPLTVRSAMPFPLQSLRHSAALSRTPSTWHRV